MDLNSFFRRFFFRNSDPKHDEIFETNNDVRDDRKQNKYEDDFRDFNRQHMNNFYKMDDFRDFNGQHMSNFYKMDDFRDFNGQHINNFYKMDDFRDFNEDMDTFHKINEVFDSMFMPSFRITIGFPKFDEQSPFEQNPSPRSIMLKDNEEKSNDSSFCKRNPQKCPYQEQEKNDERVLPFSYSKFSSFKTVRLPDGTVEEHRTVIDNDGNKKTTVRRTIGDTSHEIVTKSDKQGLKEKEENFMNMDESELTNFEQKWKQLRNGDPMEPQAITFLPSIILRKFLGLPPSDDIK